MKVITIFSAIAFILLLLMAYNVKGQSIVKYKDGNYVAVNYEVTKDSLLTVTFTDSKGNKWPVYRSKSGRTYALRTSKNGKTYRVYLDKVKEDKQ